MGDGGALWGRVVLEERSGELGPLPRRTPQNGVDEAGGMAGARHPHRLHRLVDRGVVGRGVAEEQLVEPEAERGENRRVEAGRRPFRQPPDRGVGGPPPLDRAVCEPLGLGTLPAFQPVRIGGLAKSALGEGAVLERRPHDLERDPPRLGDLRAHSKTSRFARGAKKQKWTLARSALTARPRASLAARRNRSGRLLAPRSQQDLALRSRREETEVDACSLRAHSSGGSWPRR